MQEQCCPPASPTPPVPTEEQAANEQLARLAKALGHPARVAIVRLLLRRAGCIVGDIVDELPLAQSTVSQHLKQLKAAGVIRGEVDGPRVCYCIEPGAVALFEALVAGLLAATPREERSQAAGEGSGHQDLSEDLSEDLSDGLNQEQQADHG